MSGSSFSGDAVKQLTESIGAFIQWIAKLIKTKNWFTLSILMAVAGIFLFNPGSGIALKFLGVEEPSDIYKGAFWTIELGLFATALVIAVQTMPKVVAEGPTDTEERQAIKGLRPFSLDDAEVYAKLQRHRQLRDCVDAVTSDSFRFGILMGESGCGKTSFLQAGIWPRLTAESADCRGIYIRFNDQKPTRTIAKALSEQLNIPLTTLLPIDGPQDWLPGVLQQATANQDKPLVLLFDQFEQFFVHQKRKEDRQPFIQGLSAWYRESEPLPVKILVSIRSDLLYQLDDLHQALGYALGPQDVVQIKKFTPEEATKVLEVIAQTEGLEFNQRFVTELAEDELANREDGLISPVDVQILAWMIERQTADELRAFNQSAFQKFGGVEGLLTRFLERTLDARVIPSQRQSAVKVLLALTDLDSQVRAGVLTVPVLKDTLRATVKAEDVTEAVNWLARGDVRLITPQEQDGQTGYELAHERLIPALMRLAGKELSAADRANQLLDRRVNEWLGNDRSGRYLFGVRELWQLERQRPYLVWGSKRQQKQRLIQLSWQQFYRGSLALGLIALLLAIGSGWMYLTPQGQIWNGKRQLMALLDNVPTARVTEVAVASAKNGEWGKAEKIIKDLLNETPTKARDAELAAIIRDTTAFLPRVNDNKPLVKLSKLRQSAQKIQDDGHKSSALRAIANAASSLEDGEVAKEVLSEALTAAKNIQSDGNKSSALSAIANAYGSLEDGEAAKEVLRDALTTAKDIQDDWNKSSALRAIANAAGSLEDGEAAKEVLSEALTAAKNIQDDGHNSYSLREIANAYGSLEDGEAAKEILRDALTAAKNIQDDGYNSYSLSEIANAAGSLEDGEAAKEILRDALTAAKDIQSDGNKSSALRAIVNNAITRPNKEIPIDLLNDILKLAREESSSRPMVTIATYYAKQNQWGGVLDALKKAGRTDRAVGLTRMLTALAEGKNPKLIEGAIVLDVQASGESDNYSLEAKIQTPDKSCWQRTDWWEVISLKGELQKNGRQLLDGVNDDIQTPLTVTMQNLDIQPDEEIIIRAHFSGDYFSARDPFDDGGGKFNKSGYADQAMQGSISEGFHMIRISENFAKHLETQEPLPTEDACKES